MINRMVHRMIARAACGIAQRLRSGRGGLRFERSVYHQEAHPRITKASEADGIIATDAGGSLRRCPADCQSLRERPELAVPLALEKIEAFLKDVGAEGQVLIKQYFRSNMKR